MAGFEIIYDHGFGNPGTWRTYATPPATPPVDAGPLTVGLDGSFACAIANAYTIAEANTNFVFDPTALYRITVRARTATPPTAGGQMYGGFTAVGADGITRINIDGTPNEIDSQHYAALRNTLPPAAATNYVGYVQGLAAAGSGGPNNDIANPGRMVNGTAFVRPLVYFLTDSTNGTQYAFLYRIERLDNAATLPTVRTADGTRIATTTIQQWPQRDRDRDASVLRIAGAGDPVVIWDALSSASSTITFATETVEDRTALLNVLTANQKLIMNAPCEGVSFGAPVNFYLLRLRERRVTNRGTDVRRLFDADIQEVSA